MSTLIKVIIPTLVILVGVLLVMKIFISTSPNESKRLKKLRATGGNRVNEEKESFSDRLIKPLYIRILNFFNRFTPSNIKDEYGELLTDAGMGKDYTAARLVTNQVLFFIIIGVLTFYIMMEFTGELNVMIFALVLIGSIYLPIFRLRKKVKERKDAIQKDLPNVLDMVYISVEAGLSFDAAMKMTASKMDGELSDEITRAMNEISRGRVREDALYSIAERTGVDDVRSFMSTIIQSEKLGSNISNVLRIQAEVIRDKRKQRAEETINKMPIKMLLPLVFLLLPALFIVIMGPSVINIMNTLL